jgi:hypothetical protein
MSGSATFMGRLGGSAAGFAVALGLGAAIASNPGIAEADATADTSTSSTDTAPSATEPDGGPADAAAPTVAPPGRKAASSPTRRPVVRAQRTVSQVSARKATKSAKADDAVSDHPKAPADNPAALALAGVARREIGHDRDTPSAATATAPSTSGSAQRATVTTSPLGTADQLAAEKLAERTVDTLPVRLMKLVLRTGFLSAAKQQFDRVGGPDQANVDRLDAAVDAYAMASAFQQQLLNSNKPTVVMQVAPPHTW